MTVLLGPLSVLTPVPGVPSSPRRTTRSARMYADPALPRTEALLELHTLAGALGIRRAFFVDRSSTFPLASHYEVDAAEYGRAVRLGARPLSPEALRGFVTAALAGRQPNVAGSGAPLGAPLGGAAPGAPGAPGAP